MPLRRSKRDRNILTRSSSPPTPPLAARVRRAVGTSNISGSREQDAEEAAYGEGDDDDIVKGRDGNISKEPRRTLRITVKMPSSRLREATSSASKEQSPLPSGRATRNIKKSYVVETSSEDEDEEEEEEEDYDELNDDLADDATPNAPQDNEEDEEEMEEDEDVDAEGDLEMDEDADDGVPLGHQPPPPSHPPILRVNPPAAPKSKPKVTLTPAQDTELTSVESKEVEMEDEDDDEELSELGSDEDEEVDEEVDEEEDAEDEEDGEEETVEGDEMDDDEEMAEADDSRSPDLLSRGTTPDINKMTKRQRSRLNEVLTASDTVGGGEHFLELPMEPQIKKHLTAEEHAMRRAEMARRRKNLSEKRNEEEKQDTINRLLKKQAPKRRGKISAKEIEAQDRGDMSEAEEAEEEAPILPANPIFVRWVSNAHGYKVGVPNEWLGTPIGKVFGEPRGGGSLVQEVEG